MHVENSEHGVKTHSFISLYDNNTTFQNIDIISYAAWELQIYQIQNAMLFLVHMNPDCVLMSVSLPKCMGPVMGSCGYLLEMA